MNFAFHKVNGTNVENVWNASLHLLFLHPKLIYLKDDVCRYHKDPLGLLGAFGIMSRTLRSLCILLVGLLRLGVSGCLFCK